MQKRLFEPRVKATDESKGHGGFIFSSYWATKDWEKTTKVGRVNRWRRLFFKLPVISQITHLLSFCLMFPKNMMKAFFYDYPIKVFGKALTRQINGTGNIRTYICVASVFLCLALTSVFDIFLFPGAGSLLATILGFPALISAIASSSIVASIPFLPACLAFLSSCAPILFEVLGLAFLAMTVGAFGSKHLCRIISLYEKRDTNYEKYSLTEEQWDRLVDNGVDEDILGLLIELIRRHVLASKSIILGTKLPMSSGEMLFYKKLLTEMKLGNAAYVKTFIQEKTERIIAKNQQKTAPTKKESFEPLFRRDVAKMSYADLKKLAGLSQHQQAFIDNFVEPTQGLTPL